MKINLYDLLDGMEPEELEAFAQESNPKLPKEVSASAVRKKMHMPRENSLRWQQVAVMAACAGILIACGFGIGRWTGRNTQSSPGNLGTPSFSHPSENEGTSSNSEEMDPVRAIVLRNTQQLQEMQDMANSEDETALEQYLLTVEGGGADNREDIVEFLNVVEELPIPDIIDGKVIFIQYRSDAQDATISVMARDGSWIRITYYLYADSNSLEDRYESGEFADSELDAPIYSNDNTNSIFNENRAPYPVGTGSEIVWDIQLSGITAQIYYYTNNADAVDTQVLMENLKVTNLADYL